jgi:N-acetyl sugar amidotransferase
MIKSDKHVKVCTFCLMDETDKNITFNDDGKCNHCEKAEKLRSYIIDETKFNHWVNEIKRERTPLKKYDGIIGLSGGVDSSYLLAKLVSVEIRPLVVHVDAGWNTPEATMNIYKIVKELECDLESIVINWEKMRRLQIAYLKSGIKNQDVPQDHAFFSSLYRIAKERNIKNIFTGSNWATESILPRDWAEDAMDQKQIREVIKYFDNELELDFRPISPLWLFYNSRVLKNFKIHSPLNFLSYSRTEAIKFLEKEFDWQDYGGKHRESQFTNYYQEVYLVNRFGIEKKKAHLSSLIVNNEISRAEATAIMSQTKLSDFQVRNLQEYICSKLRIEKIDLEKYESIKGITRPLKSSKYQKLLIRVITKLFLLFRRS